MAYMKANIYEYIFNWMNLKCCCKVFLIWINVLCDKLLNVNKIDSSVSNMHPYVFRCVQRIRSQRFLSSYIFRQLQWLIGYYERIKCFCNCMF